MTVHCLILILLLSAAIRAGAFANASGHTQMTPGEFAIDFTDPLTLNTPQQPTPTPSLLSAPTPAPLTDANPINMPKSLPAAAAAQALQKGAAWPESSASSILSGTDAILTAPEVRFAGLGMPRAASVVYVVDASGPMVTSLPMVLTELRRSIANLAPVQRFQVIIYRDQGTTPYQVFDTRGKRLVKATTRSKIALDPWLDKIHPAGKSNPLPGLTAAIELKPDVIFLLARSIKRSGGAWGQGRDQILAELERLNPPNDEGQRPVVIKTIQFLDEDPSGVMQAIGQIHGQGSYTVLKLEDLSR